MFLREELEKENDEIVDLAAVLAVLVDKPEFHRNGVFCELLHRFMERIDQHLSHEARAVYSEMLTHSDTEVNHAASQFISNAHELEKILQGYTKRWCVPIATVDKHEAFVKETNEIFRLLNERISMEQKFLFPHLSQAGAH